MKAFLAEAEREKDICCCFVMKGSALPRRLVVRIDGEEVMAPALAAAQGFCALRVRDTPAELDGAGRMLPPRWPPLDEAALDNPRPEGFGPSSDERRGCAAVGPRGERSSPPSPKKKADRDAIASDVSERPDLMVWSARGLGAKRPAPPGCAAPSGEVV